MGFRAGLNVLKREMNHVYRASNTRSSSPQLSNCTEYTILNPKEYILPKSSLWQFGINTFTLIFITGTNRATDGTLETPQRSDLCCFIYLSYKKKNCRLCRVPYGCKAGSKSLKKLKKSYLLFNKKLWLNQIDMNQN